VKLLVDQQHALHVQPTTTFAEVLRALADVHPAVPEVLGERTSVVIACTRDQWAQLECAPTRTLEEWLGAAARADTLHVQLAVSERCSHGSPGVPGRGYACGWC
jgi:hypothetical protein